jgi:hypothetical protein
MRTHYIVRVMHSTHCHWIGLVLGGGGGHPNPSNATVHTARYQGGRLCLAWVLSWVLAWRRFRAITVILYFILYFEFEFRIIIIIIKVKLIKHVHKEYNKLNALLASI